LTFYILHYQVAATFYLKEVQGGDDILVLKLGLALGFVEKSLLQFTVPGKLGQEKLDGNAVVEKDVVCLPHLSHPAFSDFVYKDVLPNPEFFLHGFTCDSSSVNRWPRCSRYKKIGEGWP
jgi:hypothetical protein